jgi:hypothetical protein
MLSRCRYLELARALDGLDIQKFFLADVALGRACLNVAR